MLDRLNRTIDYLRVSITDRCNFRCVYCMPPEGVKQLNHREILSYEEILKIISVLSKNGIHKVRITGGEPLVRKGVTDFIREVAKIRMIEDISLTTNGSLLTDMAIELKAAGLSRVNISLDTIDAGKFEVLTGRKKLQATLSGIQSALEAGLNPVKLNVVLTEAFTETDLAYFIDRVYHYPVFVRFIEYMPIGTLRIGPGLAVEAVKKLLNEAGGGRLEAAQGPAGNGPAKYYRLPKAQGMFGFITPLSEHFCAFCNRLRLTADGKLKPCLLSNCEFNVRDPLRMGAEDKEIADIFFRALQEKPSQHTLGRPDRYPDFWRQMSQIGG